MNFAHPWAALAVAAVALAAWRMLRRARLTAVRFSAFARLGAPRRSWRTVASALSPYLYLAGLLALVVAAMRPRQPDGAFSSTRGEDAIGIVMTVDVSGSMMALDLKPDGVRFSDEWTRLAVVKRKFAEFIDLRPDDRIALVTFGGYAARLSPLTADHAALTNLLAAVRVPQGREEQMTAIGDGLMNSLALFENCPLKSRIVILLSDGVSNFGDVKPDEAAKFAVRMGVKVYTIGVGTAARRTPFFADDPFVGRTIQYADTSFNESQLAAIAEQTGGCYFAVNDRKGLDRALAEIDRLEKTEIDPGTVIGWHEWFVWPLAAGVALTLLATCLSMAARRRPC